MQSTQDAVIRAIEVQRIRLGLTKTALAQTAGYGLPSLSKRLGGSIALDTADIDRIAAALGITPWALLDIAAEEQRRATDVSASAA